MSHSRRRRARWIAVSVGVGLRLVAPLFLPIHFGALAHRVYTESSPLATEQLWTPVCLLNSPYRGNSTGRAIVYQDPGGWGAVSTNSSGGASSALFSLNNWSLVRAGTAWSLGPGVDAACPAGLQALDAHRSASTFAGGAMDSDILAQPSGESDRGEVTTVNLSTLVGGFRTWENFSSVLFNDSFTLANDGTVSLCQPPEQGWADTAASSHLSFVLPFTASGQRFDLPVTLPASIPFEYSLPAGVTGVYSIESLTDSFGGGLAFSWSPCP